MGQGAVNTGVQASQNLASNLTGLTTGGAAAQAAGQVGAANAWSNAAQGPANYYQTMSLVDRMRPPQTTIGTLAATQMAMGGWADPYSASAGANFTGSAVYG